MLAKPLRAMRRIGRRSMTQDLLAECDAERRFIANLAIVPIDKGNARPTPWPDDIRSAVTKQSETL